MNPMLIANRHVEPTSGGTVLIFFAIVAVITIPVLVAILVHAARADRRDAADRLRSIAELDEQDD